MTSKVTEFFGESTNHKITAQPPWTNLLNEDPKNPYKSIICPFKNQTGKNLFSGSKRQNYCDKIRKAEPNPLIGNCSISLRTKNSEKIWIVCPHRFLEKNQIFHDCKNLISKSKNYIVIKEMNFTDGNIDFLLVGIDENQSIVDFIAIEVQGMGTTGSGDIWKARNDFLNSNLKNNYKFSVNQKDASKKILIQLLHKSRQLVSIKKKLVLVIQDHFYEHLLAKYNLKQQLSPAKLNDDIYFHVYQLELNSMNNYQLKIKGKFSTDLLGYSQTLISASNSTTSQNKIEQKIISRITTGKLTKLV